MRSFLKFLAWVAVICALGYFIWTGFVEKQLLMSRYPVTYSDIVSRCADEYGVPEEIIFAVIHTESRFNVSAVSKAGAKGLMQIIDSTNEWIAGRKGEEAMPERIYEPAINIDRGTWYLAYLYRQFGSWDVAAAAYNAGYGRVSGWLGDANYSSDGKTLDYIPIDETRRYVERVMEAAEIYSELYYDEN